MKFNFENLDDQTRQSMLNEVRSDVANNRLYYSKRFSSTGGTIYSGLLIDALLESTDVGRLLQLIHAAGLEIK